MTNPRVETPLKFGRRRGGAQHGAFAERGRDADHADVVVPRPFAAPLVQGWPARSFARDEDDTATDASGVFSGRGPELHQPSDEALLKDIERSIREDKHLGAEQDLRIWMDQGDVVISGSVASEYRESRAAALAGTVQGVRAVKTELTIRPARTRRHVPAKG